MARGADANDYCIGYVKGSEAECKKAKQQYVDGTVCELSKVLFDTSPSAGYTSTPIPFRVDMKKSTLSFLDKSNEAHAAIYASMPTAPIPPRTVADVARINSNKNMDIIAMVKSMAKRRESKSGQYEIIDVELVDNSKSSDDKIATIMVSVFGKTKIDKL